MIHHESLAMNELWPEVWEPLSYMNYLTMFFFVFLQTMSFFVKFNMKLFYCTSKIDDRNNDEAPPLVSELASY